jgi:riboflavin synthase
LGWKLLFAGIVEHKGNVNAAFYRAQDLLEISVCRPQDFLDLAKGDSVAVNGVCLTLESFTSNSMVFAIGPETLRITHWTDKKLLNSTVNLERSLRFNDRIHGHLVSGHVDGLGTIIEVVDGSETRKMRVRFPSSFRIWIWSKGSISLNGVSLTVNAVDEEELEVGLVPETLLRTNLGSLQVGDSVNIEVDANAKLVVQAIERIMLMKKSESQQGDPAAGEVCK